MLRQKQLRACNRPDLCVIACPYNRVLNELGQWVCAPTDLLADDQEAEIEIVYGDAPMEDKHGAPTFRNRR